MQDVEVVLDVVLGPRTDWCDADAVALLASQAWTVTPQSNRVGACQRPAGAVPGRPPADGRLPGNRLRGALAPGPRGADPHRRARALQPRFRLCPG
ncbi:hypothetical protein G6F35_018130 [Rhizopus arrhizus]|nr:hypothetical protein G6F35_018130 [Rhizopus arrhizus]